MRTYSGFLLFENLLDFIPTTNSSLYGFGKFVLSPRVPIVQEDCGTTVGTIIDLNYDHEGELELATDLTLTKARIDTLLAAGTYSIVVRSTHSCTSIGGVCQKCYAGTYIDQSIPPVGSTVEITPLYNYQTDVLRGTGTLSYFPLTESPESYIKALVIKNGLIVTSGVVISGNSLTVTPALPLNSNLVVKYYKITTQPFMGFLSKTYSGSLLGIKELPTEALPLRTSLFQSIIDTSKLTLMEGELKTFPLIPDSYKSYSPKISNKLERALYILSLYALFSNSQ